MGTLYYQCYYIWFGEVFQSITSSLTQCIYFCLVSVNWLFQLKVVLHFYFDKHDFSKSNICVNIILKRRGHSLLNIIANVIPSLELYYVSICILFTLLCCFIVNSCRKGLKMTLAYIDTIIDRIQCLFKRMRGFFLF